MSKNNKEFENINAGYPGALELDIAKYWDYVKDYDMSDEQKKEFLKSLWACMSAFVDLGWGIDSDSTLSRMAKECAESQGKDEAHE